jgi:hypothetical protein
MHMKNFPYCCTAHIAVGFGQSAVANSDKWDDEPQCDTVELGEVWLTKQIKFIKRSQHAMVVVITNNEQTRANKALLNCGFQHSVWMEKGQHCETQDRLWWADANRFKMDGTLKASAGE